MVEVGNSRLLCEGHHKTSMTLRCPSISQSRDTGPAGHWQGTGPAGHRWRKAQSLVAGPPLLVPKVSELQCSQHTRIQQIHTTGKNLVQGILELHKQGGFAGDAAFPTRLICWAAGMMGMACETQKVGSAQADATHKHRP
eukprot:1159553-Pelagomonas_calceolata.AAC.8